MMKPCISHAVLVLALLISPLRAADLDMSGLDTPADKLPAARRLLNWVQSLGYTARLSSDGEDVLVDDFKLKLAPMASTSGLDKIMVINSYAGYPGNVDNPRLQAEIALINEEQAGVNVSVKSTGGIMFVSMIFYDDKLSPRLLRLYMEYCNRAAQSVLARHPKLAECVK